MSIFHLPDLGEGLPDAEICEWHVKVGDKVSLDSPLVSMETAKAVVEVPSPESGVVTKCYGAPGDIIKTGAPLVAFETKQKADSGTVVGNIESSEEEFEDNFTIGNTQKSKRVLAGRKARALAKQHNINLEELTGTGVQGLITEADVLTKAYPLKPGFNPIKGVRRSMVRTMQEANHQIVHTQVFDDADISKWGQKVDISVRLVRALCHAVAHEPSLNAWFDPHNVALRTHDSVHLGLAMDSPEGLFVPVISSAEKLSDEALREKINQYKIEVSQREIDPKHLTGATISLSNFGKFAGKYATPIIVPPCVSIIAVGRTYETLSPNNMVCKYLPLSLSFDHRVVTGGEATRFLAHMIESLSEPQ